MAEREKRSEEEDVEGDSRPWQQPASATQWRVSGEAEEREPGAAPRLDIDKTRARLAEEAAETQQPVTSWSETTRNPRTAPRLRLDRPVEAERVEDQIPQQHGTHDMRGAQAPALFADASNERREVVSEGRDSHEAPVLFEGRPVQPARPIPRPTELQPAQELPLNRKPRARYLPITRGPGGRLIPNDVIPQPKVVEPEWSGPVSGFDDEHIWATRIDAEINARQEGRLVPDEMFGVVGYGTGREAFMVVKKSLFQPEKRPA